MVVERKIEERRAVHTHRINEACLVETHVGGAATIKLLSICLRHQSEACTHGRVAEQTDTSRVGTRGGDIGSQSLHRTTHTHIAGCTVEVATQQTGTFVSILCSGWQDDCHSQSCEKYLLHTISHYSLLTVHYSYYLRPPAWPPAERPPPPPLKPPPPPEERAPPLLKPPPPILPPLLVLLGV